MRTLYLPTDGRTSPATEAILRHTVQDTVRVDPESRTHAVYNALVTERERLVGLVGRMDVRPWSADVRQTGVVRPVTPTEEVAFAETDADDLVFGVPDRWDPVPVRTYRLDPASAVHEGLPTAPADVDRAVETTAGLVLQRGDSLWLLAPGTDRARPLGDGEFGAYRPFDAAFCLTSLTEDRLALYPTGGGGPTGVDFELEGLSVVVAEPGDYAVEVRYASAVRLSSVGQSETADGVDGWRVYESALDGFVAAGHAIADTTNAPAPETVGEGPLEGSTFYACGDGTLFYERVWRTEVLADAGATGRVAIPFPDEVVSSMYRFPARSDISVTSAGTVLVHAPGLAAAIPVYTTGRVGSPGGPVVLGHAARAVLPSEHHLVVVGADASGRDRATLVEHNVGLAPLAVDLTASRVRGVTWTAEGLLGVVDAGPDGFTVLALADVRERQAGGYTPVTGGPA